MTLPRTGLYAIVDTVTLARRGIDPVVFARAVLEARPSIVQLRAKDLGAKDALALLRRIVPLARAAKVPIFANDRPDLAVLAGCDGVHVGQDDLAIEDARAAAPGLLVGISTHDDAQVDRAIASAPDYLALGPIFPTRSKENAEPVVGLEALARVASRSPVPVVAIGGIDLARAREIANAGALGAVIGALVDEDPSRVTERARGLLVALGGRWTR